MTPTQLSRLFELQKKFIEDIALAHDSCAKALNKNTNAQHKAILTDSYFRITDQYLANYSKQLDELIKSMNATMGDSKPCH